MKQKEVRFSSEIRLEENSEGKMILEGYAILFNQEAIIGDENNGFREIIDPTSLTNTLMKDVPLKYNHMDSFLIIARTKNQSLRLSVDERGLKIYAELLDTNSNSDIYKMIRHGLLDKMSFAFTVKSQTWDRSGKLPLRKITAIDRLYDVSVVDMPAYEGTSIYARSLELADAELKSMDLEEQKRKAELVKKKIQIKSQI